jgi:transposase
MLTRYRRKLTGILSAEKNRLQKILDDAGIKLSSVVSDIDGVSAKAILKVILEKGSIAPDEVMRLAKGKLKIKTHELALSVDGKISDRHRFVLQQLQKHMHELQKQINEIDSQVVAAMQPYNEEWQLLQTIPGIDQIGAAMLLVEIGTDMTRFGNKDSLSSWAGVCPGNNESAGKKKVEERVAQIIMSKLFSANLQMEQLKPAVNLKVDM